MNNCCNQTIADILKIIDKWVKYLPHEDQFDDYAFGEAELIELKEEIKNYSQGDSLIRKRSESTEKSGISNGSLRFAPDNQSQKYKEDLPFPESNPLLLSKKPQGCSKNDFPTYYCGCSKCKTEMENG